MELILLDSQQNFPKEDITDSDAQILELLLQNTSTLENSHASAEQASILYKLGHKTIINASQAQIIDLEAKAISHGIATYEAISLMMNPKVSPAHNSIALHPHLQINHLSIEQDFKGETERAATVFTNELPRTSRVIEASAHRFYKGLTDYALKGAALARQLEIDATS